MSKDIDYSERRFLVVDDEEFMRTLIVRVLKQFGAKNILTASDGANAIQVLAKEVNPVDCIFCDYNMKPVNGLVFLKAIRTGKARDVPRDQPFVMLTGHADQDIVKIALALDVNGYVVKPAPADKLSAAADRAMSGAFKPKSESDYAQISLGESGVIEKKDEGKSLGAVVWARKKEAKDNWLEDKLKAIRDAAKGGAAQQGLKFKNVTTCWVKDLAAGMTLAEDIEVDGLVLVTAGTELTDNVVGKLKEIVEGADSMPFVKIGELA